MDWMKDWINKIRKEW